MVTDIYSSTLNFTAKLINDIKNRFTNYYTDNSLVESTGLTRVEPLVVISKDCLSLDITQDVLQADLSLFAAYYLQAVSILTKVNNIEVIKILDRLNPNRDASGFLLDPNYATEAVQLMLKENYKYKLPSLESIALEAPGDSDKSKIQAIQDINELSNLAVGKLLNVQITVDEKDSGRVVNVNIPVQVRLMPSLVSNSTIAHLLTYQSEDTSMKERFHAWRAGRISFISDLVFCQDLIDEYKRAHMGDSSGTMDEIARRVRNSKGYGLLTKNPSLATASNLFIISKTVANEVELRLRGKLSNPKVREAAFKNTYAMIIAVIDSDIDRVTFYTRGQNAAADFSFRELKAAAKGKGPDIMDIMNAMRAASPVTF